MFLPRLTPATDAEKSASLEGLRKFALSQYLKHREYQAAIGLLVIYTLLAAKFLLLK
jgi:hypothetical protein